MSISNCGHDERGKISGGQAGDQSGTEYYLRSWYNGGWNHCERHPDAKVRAKIAELARAAANNPKIGYDQGQRRTFWTQLVKAGYDPAKISTACEADCSSSTMSIVKAVGILLGNSRLAAVNQYATTSTMRAELVAAGFQDLTASKYLTSDTYLFAGDILLKQPGHTCINVTTGSSASGSQGSSSAATASGKIATVQRWVNSYTGAGIPVDDENGPKTRKGLLKCHQKAIGTTPDGIWGSDTNRKTKVLKKGSRGNDVKALQGALICLGYDTGGFDGVFGSKTDSAVRAFQRANGIAVDGQAGRDTFSKLFG